MSRQRQEQELHIISEDSTTKKKKPEEDKDVTREVHKTHDAICNFFRPADAFIYVFHEATLYGLSINSVCYIQKEGIYDPLHYISTWEDILGADSGVNITSTCAILQADTRLLNKSYTSQESLEDSSDNQVGKTKCDDKLQRCLAQNCEAARKSHLRKKAYVQQLETSRLKLVQLELEIDRTKQGLYIGSPLSASHSGSINSGLRFHVPNRAAAISIQFYFFAFFFDFFFCYL